MNADDRPARTRDVETYFKRAGVRDVHLLKGPVFFCFEGPATEDWIDHTVEVPFLADLTLQQWLDTFRAMDSNPANKLSVRGLPAPAISSRAILDYLQH